MNIKEFVINFYYKDNNNEWKIDTKDIYENEKDIKRTAESIAQAKEKEENKQIQFIKIFKEFLEVE